MLINLTVYRDIEAHKKFVVVFVSFVGLTGLLFGRYK